MPITFFLGPEYLKRRLLQELMENEENIANTEEETPPLEQPPPPPTSESPPDEEQESTKTKEMVEGPVRIPPPAGTPPEAKRAKQSSQKDSSFSPENWNGDHSKAGVHIGSGPNTPSKALLVSGEKATGNSRPASRSPSRHGNLKLATDQMEIKPLQRIQQEGEVALFQGYHSYAVRTSPVTPPLDNEEEAFPESKSPGKPGFPELKDDVKPIEPPKRGDTPPVQHQPVHEEKKTLKAEPKQEAKQHPPPEQKMEEKPEVVAEGKLERKAETKVVAKVEHKAVVKKSPLPEAAQEVEEHEEVRLSSSLLSNRELGGGGGVRR